ncbi:hypothetical protein INR49_027586 [Caranx melampygus]|nr:hypothetical protein INR49_027586 [Caranx melampygus]
MMTMHRLKPSEPDLNYASLDLKLAKKRKKHRHQKDQTQGRGHRQDQLPVQLTPPMNSFLGVEGDMDPHLPSKDTSIMVSHSSIYLNSQQIAQETEMERERGISMERENTGAWKGEEMREDEGARDWEGELDGEERQERRGVGNGTACAQLSELEASQSCADQ